MGTKRFEFSEIVKRFVELLVVAGKVNVHLLGATGSLISSEITQPSRPLLLTDFCKSQASSLTFCEYIVCLVHVFPYEH